MTVHQLPSSWEEGCPKGAGWWVKALGGGAGVVGCYVLSMVQSYEV